MLKPNPFLTIFQRLHPADHLQLSKSNHHTSLKGNCDHFPTRSIITLCQTLGIPVRIHINGSVQLSRISEIVELNL